MTKFRTKPIFVRHEGEQLVFSTIDEIKTRIESGQLSNDDEASLDGENWLSLRMFTEGVTAQMIALSLVAPEPGERKVFLDENLSAGGDIGRRNGPGVVRQYLAWPFDGRRWVLCDVPPLSGRLRLNLTRHIRADGLVFLDGKL